MMSEWGVWAMPRHMELIKSSSTIHKFITCELLILIAIDGYDATWDRREATNGSSFCCCCVSSKNTQHNCIIKRRGGHKVTAQIGGS
uniref:Uncharacterized protein n=1 Tax=Arundo donax TaxID=35708 RepID=A0A0A9BWA4_ARUDO